MFGIRRSVEDARGAAFVEKLIVYLPLLSAFFVTWELAELGAASIVVQRASAAAGRAAVVVLPDDPAHYDGEPTDTFEGRRREDIELAAGMVLSSNPKMRSDFSVDVSEPDDPEGGSIDVTVNAPYDCGPVSFMCGGGGAIELSSTTKHAYQGAKYQFGVDSSVGGGASALVDGDRQRKRGTDGVELGSTSQAVRQPGAGPSTSCSKCKKANLSEYLRRGHIPKINKCSNVVNEIKSGLEAMKTTHKSRINCVTRAEAIKEMAKDLQKRGTSCECQGGGGQQNTNWNAQAQTQVDANQCRAFTTADDKIYLITNDINQCRSDVTHEMIHVLSGPGGQTSFAGGNTNSLNEAITQYFTEEAFSGPATPAYTTGSAGVWLRCLKTLNLSEAVCEAYFKGNDDALIDSLLGKYKQNAPTFSERGKTDAELRQILRDKLSAGDSGFFNRKVCNANTGPAHPGWSAGPPGGGAPPPPPPGPGGPPPPPPPGGFPPPPPPPGGFPPPPPPPGMPPPPPPPPG